MSMSLLLTSCELFESTEGRLVRFTGSSTFDTRASYGDIVDGWQMIEWADQDIIQITSDLAKTEAGSNSNGYVLTDVHRFDKDGHTDKDKEHGSYAKFDLGDKYLGGLRWNTDYPESQHQFWAVYAKESAVIPTTSGHINVVEENLPYLMTAYAKSQAEISGVFLQFHPAFTGFEIDITTQSNVTITNCSLIPVNGANNLVASFSAEIGGNGMVKDVKIKDATKSFVDPATKETNGNTYTFNFFCLPLDYKKSSIKVECEFSVNGTDAAKSLTLPIDFKACKLHKLKLTLDSTIPDDPEPEDYDLSFEKVETMGQEIGGTIGADDWSQTW